MKHIKLFEEFNIETLDYKKFSEFYVFQLDSRSEKRMFENISEFLGGNVYSPTGSLFEILYELTEDIDKSERYNMSNARLKEIIPYESDAETKFDYHLIMYKVRIGGQVKHVAVIDESEVDVFNEDPYIFFVNANDVDYMKEKLQGKIAGKKFGL
jgi:hypothetical protein